MNEAARLVDHLSDGLVNSDEQKILARRFAIDPDFRKTVSEEWHFQRRLSCLLAEDDAQVLWRRIADEIGRPSNETQRTLAAVQRRISSRRQIKIRRRKTATWSITAAFLTAAAALIAIVVVMYDSGAASATTSHTSAPQVATMRGAVHIRRAGAVLTAAPGMALMAQDVIETVGESIAIVTLDDGSRLNLAATTALNWSGKAHFHLDRGTLDVTAEHRAVADAMTIATSRTITTVVGTRFTLTQRDDATTLRVSEGTVTFAADGGAARRVKAGEHAHHEPLPKPIAVAPTQTPAPASDQVTGPAPQLLGFSFVDAADSREVPGLELVTTDVTIALAKMPAHGWTVEVMAKPKLLSDIPESQKINGAPPALQFVLNGVKIGKPQITRPYDLNVKEGADVPGFKHRPWNPEVGTYRLEAIMLRSENHPTPWGTPLSINVTITP
jgi:FecR protein